MEDSPRSANKKQPDYCLIDGHKVRNYDIKTTEVPRLNINDPEAAELISSQVRFFLQRAHLNVFSNHRNCARKLYCLNIIR